MRFFPLSISASRFFVAKTSTIRPKLHVENVKLYVQACLLEPSALLKIHQRLSGGNSLELLYNAHVTKTFSVETGHLQTCFDITLKDPFQSVIVLIHKNIGMNMRT